MFVVHRDKLGICGSNGTTEVVSELNSQREGYVVRRSWWTSALPSVFIIYTRQVTVVGGVKSKPARLGKAQLSFGLIASSRIISQ